MANNSQPCQSITDFPRHLLSIDGLSTAHAQELLTLGEEYVARNRKANKKHPILKGRTIINLFFENSTRTRTSFELAGKRMGADVINISVASSSVKKGETLLDTAQTLNAMQPDMVVVRHHQSGAVKLLAEHINGAVINAGDGSHQHPTQALLDALTIKRRKGRIEGLNIAICGDIVNSRVARSNIQLLSKLGANLRMVAPATLMPCDTKILGAKPYYSLEEGIADCDVVMLLRIQMERMQKSLSVPSIREYFEFYGLSEARLQAAKPDALVMHPGPINRGVEIDTKLADNIERNAILEQVEMGVAIRQAILEKLAQHLPAT